MPSLLIHYHELALKGKNRHYFESKLREEIRNFLKSSGDVKVKKLSGRILVESSEGDPYQWQRIMSRIPGIANSLVVESFPADLEILVRDVPGRLTNLDVSQSFAVRARRDNKTYPFTSEDLGREVGGVIQEKTGWSVNLRKPDFEIFIEIAAGKAYVSFEKSKEGYRGLPIGVGGRGLLLLSGGFDSPVAAHLMQCRGLEVWGVHFHSAPLVSRASIDKVKEICEVLGKSQVNFRLALVPIVEFQKEVVTKCPESLRILLYRRFMLRLAEKLARKWKAKTLITGDSLGQVASQTLENIEAVSEEVKLPILRPLIGLSKEWILQKSQDIETHDISVLPHDDCCGYLMPRNPATRANSERLQEAESLLDIPGLMDACLNEMKDMRYECGRPL